MVQECWVVMNCAQCLAAAYRVGVAGVGDEGQLWHKLSLPGLLLCLQSGYGVLQLTSSPSQLTTLLLSLQGDASSIILVLAKFRSNIV